MSLQIFSICLPNLENWTILSTFKSLICRFYNFWIISVIFIL